jgi:hypothetical protein
MNKCCILLIEILFKCKKGGVRTSVSSNLKHVLRTSTKVIYLIGNWLKSTIISTLNLFIVLEFKVGNVICNL